MMTVYEVIIKALSKAVGSQWQPSGMENVMAKPTVLLEIDPFLLASPFVPSFIHQSAFVAQKLEDCFGGISLKLTGSDSTNIMAEFRWQGSTVIKVSNLGSKDRPEQISAYCPFRTTINPSTLRTWITLWDALDLAFLDLIEQKLAWLNKLKLNIDNRRLTEYVGFD